MQRMANSIQRGSAVVRANLAHPTNCVKLYNRHTGEENLVCPTIYVSCETTTDVDVGGNSMHPTNSD
jgi:hypothetical protein